MREHKLTLTDHAAAALKESAKWSMFLSIVGFIFIGLFVIVGLFMAAAMSAIPDTPGMGPFAAIKGYLGAIYIVLALVYFFPVYYLFNYAKKAKQSIDSGSDEALETAIVNLKSHHKFIGIMTIVSIVLYIVGIVAMVAFAASMGSGGM